MKTKKIYTIVCMFLALLLLSTKADAQNVVPSNKKNNVVKSLINKVKPDNKRTVKHASSTEPVIAFEKTFFNYGDVEQGGNGIAEFVVKNDGGGLLVIQNVKTSCGCTEVSFPEHPLASGESAVIKVKYNTNIVGEIKRSIVVNCNDANTPKVILRLTGEVVLKGKK